MPKSKSDIHPTPDSVFDLIYETWGIKGQYLFDPCPVNPTFDGLLIDWGKINYVNPPYSDLSLWVIKAFEEKDKGNSTIMLLPAKTDQWWFHAGLIHNRCEIVWIKGRIKFVGNLYAATQPHFLVRI